MEESIDYNAVIAQLQLENEALRRHVKTFAEVSATVHKIPDMLLDAWQKATSNKTRLLIGLMIVYVCISITFMVYDRWPGRGGTL